MARIDVLMGRAIVFSLLAALSTMLALFAHTVLVPSIAASIRDLKPAQVPLGDDGHLDWPAVPVRHPSLPH